MKSIPEPDSEGRSAVMLRMLSACLPDGFCGCCVLAVLQSCHVGKAMLSISKQEHLSTIVIEDQLVFNHYVIMSRHTASCLGSLVGDASLLC